MNSSSLSRSTRHLPAPAELDRGQVAGPHQGVGLRRAHGQLLGHLVEGEEVRPGHRGSVGTNCRPSRLYRDRRLPTTDARSPVRLCRLAPRTTSHPARRARVEGGAGLWGPRCGGLTPGRTPSPVRRSERRLRRRVRNGAQGVEVRRPRRARVSGYEDAQVGNLTASPLPRAREQQCVARLFLSTEGLLGSVHNHLGRPGAMSFATIPPAATLSLGSSPSRNDYSYNHCR